VRKDGAVIGQYPVIPRPLRAAGQEYDTVQNIDLLTDPGFRGKGVFGALERHAMRELESMGVRLVWGFPNDASMPGHIKSGWLNICKINWYLMPLDLTNLSRARMGWTFLSKALQAPSSLMSAVNARWISAISSRDVAVRRVDELPDDAEGLLERHARQRDFSFLRTVDYLNWRYARCPVGSFRCHVATSGGEVRGLAVTGLQEPRNVRLGCIYEIIVEEGDTRALRALVRHCHSELRAANADAICYPSSYDGRTSSQLFLLGFSNILFSKRSALFGRTRDRTIEAAMTGSGRKFVQWGDSDAA